MKKLAFAALLLLTSCSTNNFKNDFNNSPELLNTWTARASIQQLCDGLFEYQEDGFVVKRILIEFNRRNVSYLNCHQYNGPK